jgi:hypothetical protein
MPLKTLDTLFEEYLLRITLTKTQDSKIVSALSTVRDIFNRYNDRIEVYTQGSYATGTTVKPLTAQQNDGKAGEYDVDIVLETKDWENPVRALLAIRQVISANANLKDKLQPPKKTACESLKFPEDTDTKVGFSIDLVPIKLLKASHVGSRTTNAWRYSDTRLTVEYTKRESVRHPFLPATIMFMKRIRDVANLTKELPSLVVSALCCELYSDRYSYADDLINLVSKLNSKFSKPLSEITIHIDGVEENLAQKFDENTYFKIQALFSSLKCLKVLLTEVEKNQEKLENIFSTDFPGITNSKFDPQVSSLRSRKISISTDGNLEKLGTTTTVLESGVAIQVGPKVLRFTREGSKVKFNSINKFDHSKVSIYWQILNSTQAKNDRRGRLEKAKDALQNRHNSSENHEQVAYPGEHWIRHFVVDNSNNKLLAIGETKYIQGESHFNT